MRAKVWVLAAAALLLLPSAMAGTESREVRGDLDYAVNAAADGTLSVDGLPALRSAAADAAPEVRAFHLEARSVEAIFARHYSTSVNVLSPSGLLGDPAHEDSDTETRHYNHLRVTLVEKTRLWDLVAFSHARHGAARMELPPATYTLSNAGAAEVLVGSDVPQPTPMAHEVRAGQAATSGALKFERTGVDAGISGDFFLLLYGATFDFYADGNVERVVTGRYGQIYVRDGLPLPDVRQVNTSVLLRIRDGTFHLAQDTGAVALYAQEARLRGRIDFGAATGHVAWSEGELRPHDAPTTLEGDLLVSARGPSYSDDQGRAVNPIRIAGMALVPAPPAPASAYAWIVGTAVAVTAGAAATRWIPGVRRWAFALLAGFSMVGKEDALEQRSRSSLYDYVRANPGTTLSDVQRDVGLGWGTAVYHVSVLERLGMLVTKRVGSKRLLFVQGASRLVDPRALGLMQNPSVRQLALTLLQPGRVVTQAEIAQALDCSPQYAGRLLRKMTSVSLVMPAGETGRRAYQATPMMPEVARRAGLPPTPPAPEAVAAAIVPATA